MLDRRIKLKRREGRGEKTEPLKEAKLSIQLQQSTVEELRGLSWDLDKQGNDRTYDQLIMDLIQSFIRTRTRTKVIDKP